MTSSTSPHPVSGSVHNRVESGIALTFDDGPDPFFTTSILDHLAAAEVLATFFLVGELLASNEDLIRRIADDGHGVGSHGWDHVRHSKLSDTEILSSIERSAEAISAITGEHPALFRPPYGDHDNRVVAIARENGQAVWLWSVDARDWERPGTEAIVRRVVEQIENGSVVLLHDGRGERSQTVAAVPSIIDLTRDQGYAFVPIATSA